MKKILIASLIMASLSGCVTMSPNAFSVSQDQIARRDVETRKFDGVKEDLLLSASANVLQDLGYNLDSSETKLGLITASKERDATNAAQVVGAVLLAILGGGQAVLDQDQKIVVSLVVRPLQSTADRQSTVTSSSHFVRITFQRVVRRSDGSSFAETLKDEELYSGFFEKLSKSVFIEGQKI